MEKVTDEARIARLTELARRVWPGDKLDIVVRGEAVRVMLGGEDTGMPMITTSLLTVVHPRALDALEAALLVLANGDRRARAQQFFEGLPALSTGILAVGTHAAADVPPESPAWVEQLAGEMEEDHRCGDATCMTDLCFWAKELRERAKKP